MEALRTLVQTRTGSLTDGQFFGFGLLALVMLTLLIWVIARIVSNYITDYRLRRHLRGMSHGGLHFEGRKRRWEKR